MKKGKMGMEWFHKKKNEPLEPFSTDSSAHVRTAVQLKSDNASTIWFVINNTEKNRVRLMYASVDGCAFWLPSTLQQQKKKSGPFTLVQCKCHMLEYEHLFHHHPGADSMRAQMRPDEQMSTC